jgi:hypothetical protein
LPLELNNSLPQPDRGCAFQYFFESVFNSLFYKQYIGSYSLGNQVYSNVFYECPNFNRNTGVKGFIAPKIGLIQVMDTINAISYAIIK